MGNYEIVYEPEYKAENINKQVEDNVAEHQESMSNSPQYKVIIPQYMYKPAWGFPRYQPLGLLRQLGKNVYASSIFKTIKDVIIDTPRKVVAKEGIDVDEELQKKIDEYQLFFERPNPEETFSSFIRKVLDDIFKYDSGVINKVFNLAGELIQLRAAPGDTFKKNPNKRGYLDERDDIILDKTPSNALIEANKNPRNMENGFANTAAFQFYTNFIDKAAYFQFVNSVASQIPIPYGKRELCWLTSNPSTDNVYTNGAPLEDAIDLILSLIYGLKFNLDFYMNGNTPEGIVNAVGATKKDLAKIKDQLNLSINTPRDQFGLKRRIGYRMPIVNMDNLDFVKLNMTSKEMEILEQQKWFTKILWMRFGVNADEMGFTENSNRATSGQQTKNSIRKSIKPIYVMIEECFTYDILSEFEDGDKLRFEFDFYDPIDQKEIRDLQQQEISMGINSARNIMNEEGINADEIESQNQDAQEFDFNLNNPDVPEENNPFPNEMDKADKKEKEKPETKSFTTTTGGTGTTDNVMNPIYTDRKTIIKKNGKWVEDKETRHETKAEDTPDVPLETPLEKVMGMFIKKIDAKNKEIIEDSEDYENEIDDVELKHKYIKRTGNMGNYKYFYRDNKTGKIFQGSAPKKERYMKKWTNMN